MTALTAPDMSPGRDLLDQGRKLAGTWTLGRNAFLDAANVASEAEYKRRCAAQGRIMQHAHIGFRSIDRTVGAIREIQETAAQERITVDRFGITLDWTMGYPPDRRDAAQTGTGIVLQGPEDFARITNASPAASHFGDFMLGLPGGLHNVQAALAAGATAIGNLGQYFTFRLPYWDDDVATTEATVTAIGLIAAQPAEVLIHSNLDDGFVGLYRDMTSSLGTVLIEKHIVEDLIGARLSYCWGHHFSNPASRAAFHAAMARVTDTPGTMLYGNTVAYRRSPAANYASLASYLLADITSLGRTHTGHAINPVPVTENQRIPDIDEILDAQRFAARLVEHAPEHGALIDVTQIDALADRLMEGGIAFRQRAMQGLADRGVDVTDPAALLLAIRRLGAHGMETLFGNRATKPLVPVDWALELDRDAAAWCARQTPPKELETLKVALGTSDVHEHGAYLVREALTGLGVTAVEVGTSLDAEQLVDRALAAGAEAIAVSTYNGLALRYAKAVLAALDRRGTSLPLLIGGKLNEIPAASNTDLPVDVTEEIRATGAYPCADLDEMLAALTRIAERRPAKAG